MRNPRPRFNVIEVTMLIAFAAALGFVAGGHRTEYRLVPYISADNTELAALERRYGPSRNSEHAEEWILRDYFHDRRNGVFVDVGANDYRRFSNTYYLEASLGWSGIAVEPQTKFAADYATYRPRTTFVPLFVSDTANREAILNVPANNDLIASADATFVRAMGGESIVPLKTNTTTLDDVLMRATLTSIDFLSIDVELHEPEVLRGFSIERAQPRLVCVEAHPEVRQQILDYFAAHDYVLLGRYLRVDSANLWFEPRHASAHTG